MNLRINITLSLLLLFGLQSPAQNLVPNHSFENISSCPNSNSQYHLATPWQKPQSSITTPDLFNSCYSGGGSCTDMDVPGNFAGTANARTGNGYAGLITKYTVSNLREYLVIQLTSPLTAGVTYEVGAYIRLTDFSRYATNHFGLHLSNNMLSQTTGCCNNGTINLNPSVEENSVISNRNSWTLVGGTYSASGGEQYLTIGCFSPDNQNNIVDHGNQGGTCALVTAGAYYYVDDAFVRVATPLDIEGLSFFANNHGERQVMLNWTLTDASRYESLVLEHSDDGESFEDLTSPLAVEDGSYLDPQPYAPDSWYRLRAKDKEGAIHFSEVRHLTFEPTPNFSLRAWPNPIQDQLSIEIQSDMEIQSLRLELSDYLGRNIRTEEVDGNAGTTSATLSGLGQLAAGVYFLKASNDKHQEVIKLIRQ